MQNPDNLKNLDGIAKNEAELNIEHKVFLSKENKSYLCCGWISDLKEIMTLAPPNPKDNKNKIRKLDSEFRFHM